MVLLTPGRGYLEPLPPQVATPTMVCALCDVMLVAWDWAILAHVKLEVACVSNSRECCDLALVNWGLAATLQEPPFSHIKIQLAPLPPVWGISALQKSVALSSTSQLTAVLIHAAMAGGSTAHRADIQEQLFGTSCNTQMHHLWKTAALPTTLMLSYLGHTSASMTSNFCMKEMGKDSGGGSHHNFQTEAWSKFSL